MENEAEETMDMYSFANICLTHARVANAGPHPRSIELSPRRLLITCRVLPVRFLEIKLTEAQRNQGTEIEFENTGNVVMIDRPALNNNSLAVLEVWEGIHVGAPYDLDQDLEQKNCVIGLLFLSVNVFDHKITQIGCLMVRQLEDGFYERVGLVRGIMPYLVDGTRSPMIFLDVMGNVIDRFKVPERRTEQLFDEVGERKTICLL